MKPKTTHTNRQIPRLAPATAMGIETLQIMKTKLTLLKLTILLCFTLATTAAFGQTLIWTNPVVVGPNGNNIGVTTNWSGGSPVGGTVWEFNGTVPGPMLVYQNDGIDHNSGNLVGGTAGGNGGSIYVNASQTSPVQLSTTASPASINMGFNTLTVDLGAGQLTLGDNTANILATVGRPSGTTHDFINNSANPVIICPNFEWQNGGGLAMVLEFDSPTATPGSGIGDYGITNSLNSGNSGTISLWFVSSGVITWSGPSIAPVNGTIASPIFLNAGTTLILKTNNLLTSQAIQNNAPLGFGACPLIYDGHAAQTLSGIIGAGTSPLIAIQVKSGTLTLSGVNIFTGDVTISGGELVANRAEVPGTSGALGTGNTIHLTGGTLGWTAADTYDYSSRFDTTTAGQAYNFDTGGQNVTLASSLGSGGGATLTKSGNGILTLTGTSSYGGLTTVSFGKLIFQGSKTGNGNVSVADGAGVAFTDTGTQTTPGTLTLGSVSGATLGFYNVNNTTTAPLKANTLSSAGTLTVNINTGTFAVGSKYPLLTWTTGSSPTLQLGVLNGYTGFVTNDTATSVSLVITGTAYSWTGNNNGSWDLTTANNWQRNSSPVVFGNGVPTLFDDTAISANLNVTIGAAVSPSTLTVNNNTNLYEINSSAGNDITGGTGLTKQGTNTLSLAGGANTYTGVTTLSSGTVTVGALANGGSASDIGAANNNATNLVLDGGTLQYTNGTVQIDRLFQITTGGGAIDASGVGALQLTNTGAIGFVNAGPRSLILTGTAATNNTMAPVIGDNQGATALVKNGAGEWDLTGNNTYSGVTTINGGVLRIGQASSTGSLGTGATADNSTLLFNRTNSLTYGGAISGGGAVTLQTGTLTLTGNNSYSGGTSISNGATLNIGSGGAGASLLISGPIINNSMLVFNSSSAITIRGFPGTISGTGNIEDKGTGLVNATGYVNTWTGWLLIDAGATFQPTIGNESQLVCSAITNNGTLLFERQDNGVFIYSNNITGSGKLVMDANNQNARRLHAYRREHLYRRHDHRRQRTDLRRWRHPRRRLRSPAMSCSPTAPRVRTTTDRSSSTGPTALSSPATSPERITEQPATGVSCSKTARAC